MLVPLTLNGHSQHVAVYSTLAEAAQYEIDHVMEMARLYHPVWEGVVGECTVHISRKLEEEVWRANGV